MPLCRTKYHIFSFKEGCEFYQYMMQFLIDKGLIEEVLHHGSSFEIMQMYLEEARKYMLEHYGLRLLFKRPFTWLDMPVKRATKVIAKYLRQTNTASIIRFENKDCGDHWSMIKSVPSHLKKFMLFDSYLYSHLEVETCQWEKGKNAAMCRVKALSLLKFCLKNKGDFALSLTKLFNRINLLP